MRAAVLAVAVVCLAGSEAAWEIPEDVALGSASVVYKAFKDEWTFTFEHKQTESFTYVIPQVCRASSSVCGLGQISFARIA